MPERHDGLVSDLRNKQSSNEHFQIASVEQDSQTMNSTDFRLEPSLIKKKKRKKGDLLQNKSNNTIFFKYAEIHRWIFAYSQYSAHTVEVGGRCSIPLFRSLGDRKSVV